MQQMMMAAVVRLAGKGERQLTPSVHVHLQFRQNHMHLLPLHLSGCTVIHELTVSRSKNQQLRATD